ncbi:MAG: CDP-diacylglycerol--glycerol-3-phosphate 3-phosphatidyltransferase, partial [Acidobacteria bacterium]|nr:CDP-diacylglycerol--glycerol-3-phosphate 3-phosphatidyltransferase [Acidobacteriota bacterium]
MSVPPTDTASRLVLEPQPAPKTREDVASQIWNLPNSLTLFRIFLVPFLVAVLLTKFTGKEYVGLGIFLVAAFTDFLDGFFARRRNQMTRLGALLDPIADKLLMSAAFISLVELGLAKAWMVVIIIGREFAVSGLRSIAAQQGVTIGASPLGKGK